MDLTVNERIQFTDRYLATIRYVGHIKQWGNDITALGIEWDDPSRGKNSGILEGVQYFQTTVEGAGSFIKCNNKKLIRNRNTFEASLRDNYGQEFNHVSQQLTIGLKQVESLGFEKLNKMNSDFSKLQSITLDFKCIYGMGQDTSILGSLKSLSRLDVSFNLFTDISEIWGIIDCIPNLMELNINGNRFSEIQSSNKMHSLKVLRLSNTNINFKELVELILPKFPHLRELTVASNGYTDADIIYSNHEFDSIDLSFNRLKEIPRLKTKNLNLTNNLITYVSASSVPEIIDLRYNKIDNWDFIDVLSKAKNLRDIKITENPLFLTMNEDDVVINLIGRIKCVEKRSNDGGVVRLNGSELLQQEIDNAELYFVSKVRRREYFVSDENDNWKRLKVKYYTDDKREGNLSSEIANSRLLLKIVLNDKVIAERNFSRGNTVLRLKGYVSRLIDKKLMDFRLMHHITEDLGQVLDNDNKRLGDLDLLEQDEIIIDFN